MKARILVLRSWTDRKVPRWMAWRSMMENHTSARFIQDARVGVKWTLTRVVGQPGLDVGVHVGGVVVHHQMQFAVGVGAGDLFAERQEFLVPVPVPGLAGRG